MRSYLDCRFDFCTWAWLYSAALATSLSIFHQQKRCIIIVSIVEMNTYFKMYSNHTLVRTNNIVLSHAQHYAIVSPSILDWNSKPFDYRWGKHLTVVDENWSPLRYNLIPNRVYTNDFLFL